MCRESCNVGDFIEQKFGMQRGDYGNTQAQKSLNGFDHTIYYPTNWRGTYDRLLSKFPAFIRYGGLVPINPEWFQRNYLGIYPIKQQPQIDEGNAFDKLRFS